MRVFFSLIIIKSGLEDGVGGVWETPGMTGAGLVSPGVAVCGAWPVWLSGFECGDCLLDGFDFGCGVGKFFAFGFDYGCGCVADEAFV